MIKKIFITCLVLCGVMAVQAQNLNDACLIEGWDTLTTIDTIYMLLDSIADTTWAEGDCDSVTIYGKMFTVDVPILTVIKVDSCNLAATGSLVPVDTTVNVCELGIQRGRPGNAAGQSAVLAGSPNPFRKNTLIIYSLPRAQPAFIRILNEQGSVVRTVSATRARTGFFNWNARDQQGRMLPSGRYLVTLKTEDRIHTTRLILAR